MMNCMSVKVKTMKFNVNQAIVSQDQTYAPLTKGSRKRRGNIAHQLFAAVALSSFALASPAAFAQKGPSKLGTSASHSGVPSSFGPAPQLSVGSNEEGCGSAY
jgi:hypothetical protein